MTTQKEDSNNTLRIEIVDTEADELNLFYSMNQPLVKAIIYGPSEKRKAQRENFAQDLLDEVTLEADR
jgi:hypothetical protein